MGNIISMAMFSIMSAAMASKFIVDEYTGKKAILLFSYPVDRKKVLDAKIIPVVSYTVVSMLICNSVALTIFLATESLFPLCQDTINVRLILNYILFLFCCSLIAALLGVIYLWFHKKVHNCYDYFCLCYRINFVPSYSHDTFCTPCYHWHSYINHFDCNDSVDKLTLSNRKHGGIRQKMNLIFLHGLGQSTSSWNETLSLLPRYTTAYCLDLLGLCMDNKRVYENMYSAFEKYADEYEEPINLCGISLGAVLALNYAIDNPQKVASLILIAPQYKMPQLLLSIQSMVFHILPQRAFQKIGFNKKDMISMANSMRLLNFTPMLKNIVCPVLIVCGDRDMSNKKASKALAKNISGTQLSFVENAGHEVNVDAPAKLANLIKEFWFNE